MESVELKLRLIDNPEFVIVYTKQIVEILRVPEMSLEVKTGKISEEVCRLLESLGYKIAGKKPMADWVQIKAVPNN